MKIFFIYLFLVITLILIFIYNHNNEKKLQDEEFIPLINNNNFTENYNIVQQQEQEIIPNLFLGSSYAEQHYNNYDLAINLNWPSNHVQIGNIIISKYNKNNINEEYVTVIGIGMNDTEEQDIMFAIPTTNDYINNALINNNKVIVNCMAGISRSSTIIIAYLLKLHPEWSVDDTITFVKNKRNIINPNPGFIDQLNKLTA